MHRLEATNMTHVKACTEAFCIPACGQTSSYIQLYEPLSQGVSHMAW